MPLGIEPVGLDEALGRVLALDVVSPVDVPSFDRSNVDGFAVVAQDTFGASEEVPRRVRLSSEVIHTGVVPATVLRPGEAVAIATGGMMPRGADAVVMVEHADVSGSELRIGRAVAAGSGVSFAATDITAGEAVLRRGTILTSRDTGVLAAIGVAAIDVWRRPIVAILSTGDEIIAPGQPMRPARVYDSNAQVLADAVRELGGEPRRLGIVADDADALRVKLRQALAIADIVLLSGGTSKGAGDVSYRVVAELTDPGIVAHGVALKPGKPICLAATEGRPVVVLPGFPTSAIFTFHEFVAPVISALAGRSVQPLGQVQARLAVRVNSEIGRTEYVLVGLVDSGAGEPSLAAYPMGQGSGSVTTFSRADGFTTIGRHEEIVPAGTTVTVQLLGRELQLPDLVVIGSHCVGLDYLLGVLQGRGVRSKFLAVGSLARARGRPARRVRPRRHPLARSRQRRLQPTVPHSGAPADSGLRAPAGAGLPPRRHSLRGPGRGGGDRQRRRRSRLRDGEPECRQRHQGADRSAPGRSATRRLRRPASQPQCGGGGGGPAPRRLGRHARHRGTRSGSWVHSRAGRAVPTSWCRPPGHSAQASRRSARSSPTGPPAKRWYGWA